MALSSSPFVAWCSALEQRHLANLTFQEVRRALRSLSAVYVENRCRIGSGAALDGAGKRAAFALFYGPLHYLVVRHVVDRIDVGRRAPGKIIDLGCGTGAAGAAWAIAKSPPTDVLGIDRHPWALSEASWTYGRFGIRGRVRRGHAARVRPPAPGQGLVAAFTVNELDDDVRDGLLSQSVRAARSGTRVLIVEPIAKRSLPWWDHWAEAFVGAGGRADTWRFRTELPEIVRRLDRAAGLDHAELTARSLYLPGDGAP